MRNDVGSRGGNHRTGTGDGRPPVRGFRSGPVAAALLLCLSQGARAQAKEAPVEKMLWVRGETYLVGSQGDTLPDAELETSADGRGWSRAESRMNGGKGGKGGKSLAATASGALGKRQFRLRDAKTGRIMRRMEVTLLPEAGSPETGPYLELQGKWDGELIREQAGGRATPPRNRAFLDAVFRLSKAKGGESLSNTYDRMNRAILDTVHAYASLKNVLPVGICRVHFHYVQGDPSQARRGQYARVSLGKDTSETNLVTFMARPVFMVANAQDPVTSIDISGDGFSLTLPPDGQAEATIAGTGLKRIRFLVHTASGKKLPGETLLFVKRALTRKEIDRRNGNLARHYEVVRPGITFAEGADE